MARKKDSPIGVGMTAKQMKRKRPINADLLNKIEPITDNQKTLFDNYKEGKNIFAYGDVTLKKAIIITLHASFQYRKNRREKPLRSLTKVNRPLT